ncbi:MULTISPECIES: aldehyde ferredoxin oxidoreductase family protein [unclassified Oceanispirochaeta]|uniref:aldehyde ferredoxin oxidoreductase family protein n=1 Tax=unclassified Oceanispirochaeta TaxID=2635722 RepID=UPI000E09060E|nr:MULTISPECIES: aldehyde ferredoxin oxidoreductase family protein [unclassified Oceanispirochaeta]MBF9015130.1 aldehyde ferredoxin oxidoreductase family protein [Oceanispirochaeta sp. M2]NPD71588.1 aldehyde ferredoxin oxidoreductase family protein [Oceanispirochaeta sp. M1]RDG33155.1 hypothetical protein DV872_05690 [Oceanispirochaeta sp. M1]
MAWCKKLLRIDMKRSSFSFESIPDEILQKYIGGKGLGTAYFVKEVPPKTDPLDPENSIYVAPGAFSGSPAPASSRFHVVTKSPLTNIYLDGSSGGHFGPELRAFGIDLLIIEGKAEKLTGLYLQNDSVTFLDVSDYTGLGIYDTEKRIREQLKDSRIRVTSIGEAGERMVKFACLGNDFSRNIGRGGVGAVFGSKNLKLIAVKGAKDIVPSQPEYFISAMKKTSQWIASNPWVPGTRANGTPGNVDAMNELGILPAWNFSGKEFKGAEKINHVAIESKLVRRLSCANCPVSCSKGYRDSTYTGGEMEGPEFETLCLLGSNIGLDDPQGIAALNYLCNQFGIDTITTGAISGLVFDAIRRGLVDKKIFGLSDSMNLTEQGMHLISIMCKREGIGDILAQGSKVVAEYLNMAGEAPEVKGLDLAGYDPRSSTGMSLAYQTSDRGACHLRSFPIGRELSGVLEPGDSTVGKAAFVSTQQNAKAAEECLGICQFPYGIGINDSCITEMLTAFVGYEYTVEALVETGERIWNLSRLFSNACGISRKDDYLPEKITNNPMQYGPSNGRRVTQEMQDQMLDEYYELRGWDNNGIPTADRLEQLLMTKEAEIIYGFSD